MAEKDEFMVMVLEYGGVREGESIDAEGPSVLVNDISTVEEFC